MNEKSSGDEQLGMGREITRRDFLNGVAIGVGGAVASKAIGGILTPWQVPG
jgi:hypothetical protein